MSLRFNLDSESRIVGFATLKLATERELAGFKGNRTFDVITAIGFADPRVSFRVPVQHWFMEQPDPVRLFPPMV